MVRNQVVGITAVVLMAISLGVGAERVVLEGILVRVNDRIITVFDFEKRMRMEMTQMPPEFTSEQLSEFAGVLYEELVNELLLLERATEKRVVVDDSMVDRALENLRKENNLEEEEAWQAAIKSSGLDLEQLRERYRRSILLQNTVQSEVRPTEITEEELRQEYEKTKDDYRVPAKVELEQIFITEPVDGLDQRNVQRQARGLVERVRNGADLKAEATLAGVALQELGKIPVADCRPELANALQGLEDGDLTEPLAVPGGMQIIRLVRRIPAGFQSFGEVKDEIRRQKSNEDYATQTRGMVERLKQEYLVEVYPDRLQEVIERLSNTPSKIS